MFWWREFMNWNDFEKIFGECELLGNKILIKSKLYEVIDFIYQNYSYKMLKQIVAIDLGDNNIELIYNLYSIEDEENMLISIIVQDEADSVVDIFKSAQADENEIYDMFGINFIGNKGLKRLYMPESWKGHPLKKDYMENDERLRWNEN